MTTPTPPTGKDEATLTGSAMSTCAWRHAAADLTARGSDSATSTDASQLGSLVTVPDLRSQSPARVEHSQQTPEVFDKMHEYANRFDLQTLMNRMMASTFNDQPEDLIAYLNDWLESEGRKHVAEAKAKQEAAAAAKQEALGLA
eukprot:jgi/Tetstr1/459960/TSEL_000466.t1